MNDLIARLVAEGVSAQLVADVAVALAKAQAANDILEQRRENERNRKAKARSVTGCHVTGRDDADTPEQPLSLSPNENNSTPHTHTPDEKPRARKGWPLPDGVSAEQWAAFCAQRKKPLNERAYSLLTAKLTAFARAGWPPGDLIDTAIERGWETIFAPKEHRNGQRPANDQPASPATAIAAARRNLGVDGQFGAG